MHASPAEAATSATNGQTQIQSHLRALEGMTVNELRDEHYRVLGVATRARNKRWLMKKVFFRLQEITEGRTLSDEALALAKTLAEDVPVRVRPKVPKELPELAPERHPRDARLPPVGSTLTREHRGTTHEVLVLEKGFSYQGTHCRSLSAVAKAITGTRWNGFLFFGLTARKNQPGETP